jgi:hypothetical protein
MAMDVPEEIARERRRAERARRRALRPVRQSPAPPPDPRPARTHGLTRRALVRYGLRGLGVLAVGAALALAVLALSDRDNRRYDELLHYGTRTTGMIQSVHQRGRRLGLFSNRMRVDFVASGVPHSTTVWLDENARRYQTGHAVPVVYDAADPGVATVVGEVNAVWWHRLVNVFLGLFSALAIATALTMWRALWRWWRTLRRAPWIAADFEFTAGEGQAWSTMAVSPLTPDAQPAHLIVKATPRRVAPLRHRPPDWVWVASDKSGHPVALATPGPDRLYITRRYDANAGILRYLWAHTRPG